MLLLEEATTQGNLLAMQVYALLTLLLINWLSDVVTWVWYADDAQLCQ